MGWILRTSETKVNPTLPGGVYGSYITAGRPVYWRRDTGSGRTYFIVFISDGGRYGLDSVSEVSYQGGVIPSGQYVFHRGKYTKQVSPNVCLVGSVGSDTIEVHPGTNPTNYITFTENMPVRLYSSELLPGGVINNQKYYVKNLNTASGYSYFNLSLTPGGSQIDITSFGSGTIRIYKADAGRDDPEQGLPTHCPEVDVTFSGIAYIEGYINTDISDEPNWQDFRIVGIGRRLMDYDATGTALGVTSDYNLLTNPALICADVMLVEYKKSLSRIGWASWKQFRDASAQKIWQKSTSNLSAGLVGEYFNWVDGSPVFTNPVILRTDSNIDFNSSTTSPAPGIGTEYFTIRWKGQISVPYSEIFQISVVHDDTCRIKIDNQLIINGTGVGTHTGGIYLETGKKYDIEIEFTQVTGPWYCQLYWQSTSQSYQIIPSSAFSIADVGVNRYVINMAFASPTEASEVFDRVIDRCPGWNWTDKNGKIEFLGPTRPVVYEFIYDSSSPDVKSTFLDGEFEAKKRSKNEKPNFSLYEVRDVQQTNFPTIYVEADRPQLREFGNTSPDNNEPIQLGVMTRSQAERIAELEMVIKSDARHTYNLGADRGAGGIAKAEMVKITHYVQDNKKVADEYALVSAMTRQGHKLDFTLLPVPLKFYEDIVYVPPISSGSGGSGSPGGGGGGGGTQLPPTDLILSYLSGQYFSQMFWTNHGAAGDVIVSRDYNGQGFNQIANLGPSGVSFQDDYVFTTGTYTYRISNTSASGYIEASFYAYFGYGGGYGGGCFAGWTPVSISSNKQVIFKDLFTRKNEFIGTLTDTFTKENRKTRRKIIDIFRVRSNEFCVIKFSNGLKRKSTPKHRYWTKLEDGTCKFIEVNKLKAGDLVFDDNLNLVSVISVKYKQVKNAQWFYNMTVDFEHAYFIGLAVSNLKPLLD